MALLAELCLTMALLLGPEAELERWLLGRATPAASPANQEDPTVQRRVREAETLLLDGAARAAARGLGALLKDPRLARRTADPALDAARYYLASALAQDGALGRARGLLLELMAREPPSDHRAPALRRLTDLTLASGQFEPTLTGLQALRLAPEDADEVAYLKGKALASLGHREAARQALDRLSPHARWYASAQYLRALLALEVGLRDEAEDALCRLVRRPPSGREPFFLSDQAAQAVAHAWLALARLRYEGGAHAHAVETYRRVVGDPDVGPQARHELAWALHRAARPAESAALLEALLVSPTPGPDDPAARLLLAYVHMESCRFDRAAALLESDAAQLEALQAGLDDPPADPDSALPGLVRAWVPARRAERRAARLAARTREDLDRLTSLRAEAEAAWAGRTEAGPRRPGSALAAGLEAERQRARHLAQRATDLRARMGRAESARQELEELRQVAARVSAARVRAERALGRLRADALRRPPPGAPAAREPLAEGGRHLDYLAAELSGLEALGERALLTARAAAAHELQAARDHLGRARLRVTAWARQAMLGKVDLVVGRKQALETEVQNLALGRYPLSLLKELAEAGALGEDMEYWPYDGEGWPDEYE
jgi:hypothetical protein